jgi:uncharacterized membrane protein YidH (DUF202 family)
MKQKLAQITSLLFHPLVFAILGPFLVIYHRSTDVSYGIKWTLFSLFFILCGLLLLFLLRPRDLLTDFDISKREKRPLFYSISLFFAVMYFITAVYLKTIFFPMSIVALGIVIGVAVFEIANIFLKVSIHVAVSCAFVITVGLLYGMLPFLSVMWIPFTIIWSRLLLKKHTRAEVIGGAAIGCTITLITFAIAELLL